jgi:hypothetical protein
MKTGWLVLAVVATVAGCAQHPPGWDDAWAACQAEALEAAEVAQPGAQQRSVWVGDYIDQCMDKKGFKEPETI